MWKLAKHHWVLVIVATGCLFYLPFLGQRPFYAEEGRRVLQVIALLQGGSWWQLDVGGAPYVAKPPMLPWLMALSSFITAGINEWAVRLPSVIAAILAAIASGGIASTMMENRGGAQHKRLAALIGGLAFLTCPSIIERTRIGETDLVATAGVALAFWAFFAARSRNQFALAHWIGIAASLAAAALAKGPIPLAFAVIPMVATFVLDRDWKQLAIAVLVLCAALAPLSFWAYVNLEAATGDVWAQETRTANVNRLFSLEGLLPLLYLRQVPRWLVGMLPWIIPAGIYVWQRRREIRQDPLLRALLLYAIPMSLVVLLWPDARGRYALPAIVPVMALAGVFIAEQWSRIVVRRIFAISAVCLGIAAVGVGAIAGHAEETPRFRANVRAFDQLLQERGVKRVHFVDSRKVANVGTPEINNFLAYARRPVRINDQRQLGLPVAGDVLILGREDDVAPEALSRWKRNGTLGTTGLTIYFPAERRS